MAIYNISGGGGGSGGSTPTVDTSSLVPKSIGTAAGDMIYWSAANTPTRLAKGSNGQVLSISGGVPTWTGISTAGDYLPLTGGTVTGDVTIKKSTTIANNYPATLNFSTVQTDSNITNTAYIKVYDDHDTAANGSVMVVNSKGLTIIGGGESPQNIYDNAVKGKTANANLTTVGASTPE